MSSKATAAPAAQSRPPGERRRKHAPGTAFGCPRDFLANRYVYLVISPRAGGLSVGVNFNPDRSCDFDCVYCEVERRKPPVACQLDIPAMAAELESTLLNLHSGGLFEREPYSLLTPEMTRLHHVAISGDGEPTLCPMFREAVEAVTHLRASLRVPYFKLVLITNASGLDRPTVQEGLKLFTLHDEIWAKLDVGTQAAMDRINRAEVPLDKILENIRNLGRQRPIIIQSLFTAIDGQRLPATEVEAYAERLRELAAAGAQIRLVQVYSANRPSPNQHCSHLDLKELSHIARIVREVAGLRAEVF